MAPHQDHNRLFNKLMKVRINHSLLSIETFTSMMSHLSLTDDSSEMDLLWHQDTEDMTLWNYYINK